MHTVMLETIRRSTQPVNLEILLDIADGNAQQAQDLTDLYFKNAWDHLCQIDDALKEGNSLRIEELAHGLAGSSALVGMVGAVPQLRTLEDLGARRQLAPMKSVVEDVRKALTQMTTFLEEKQLARKPSTA